jgi:hypothetical protein
MERNGTTKKTGKWEEKRNGTERDELTIKRNMTETEVFLTPTVVDLRKLWF